MSWLEFRFVVQDQPLINIMNQGQPDGLEKGVQKTLKSYTQRLLPISKTHNQIDRPWPGHMTHPPTFKFKTWHSVITRHEKSRKQ